MPQTVWTVGHSSLSSEAFFDLLSAEGITAVADVRSAPYSRRNSHFDREEFKGRCDSAGVAYSFLGKELGGRPRHPKYFCDGVADYEKMAESESFKSGLTRVLSGSERYKVAVMCSERHPLDCHRCLLVGRRLAELKVNIKHLLHDGSVLSQPDIEERLLSESKQNDLFASIPERVAAAYRERNMKVGYVERGRSVLQAAE